LCVFWCSEIIKLNEMCKFEWQQQVIAEQNFCSKWTKKIIILKLTTDVYVHNLCALCIKNLKIIIIVINLYLVAISCMRIGCTRNEHKWAFGWCAKKSFFFSFYVLFLKRQQKCDKILSNKIKYWEIRQKAETTRMSA